jgi:hypothetical protein
MMISDERFFAWLDGELDPAEAAAIDQLVAADPDLQRKAEAHRALHGSLRAVFDPIADAPVPQQLTDAALPRQAEVIDLSARREARRPFFAPMQWAAMAATLAIGLVAGSMINIGPSGPVARENGQLVASGELEQALYARLASSPADKGARMGLTFRDAAGDLCRSFVDDGTSGLACHQGGDGRIRGLFQAGEGQQGQFRMAAGPDPRMAQLIESTIAGDPLDAAGEQAALASLK